MKALLPYVCVGAWSFLHSGLMPDGTLAIVVGSLLVPLTLGIWIASNARKRGTSLSAKPVLFWAAGGFGLGEFHERFDEYGYFGSLIAILAGLVFAIIATLLLWPSLTKLTPICATKKPEDTSHHEAEKRALQAEVAQLEEQQTRTDRELALWRGENLETEPTEQLDALEAKLHASLAKLREARKEQELCIVCKDAKRAVIFVPCGHYAVCSNSPCKSLPRCPICQVSVNQTAHVYKS